MEKPFNKIQLDCQAMYQVDLSKLEDLEYDDEAHAKIRLIGERYRVQGSRYLVSLPTHATEKLALFLGLFYGDGSLVNFESAARNGSWRIDFTEGDEEVVRLFAKLGKEIFNVDFKVQYRKTWYAAYVRSKIVYRFLSKICGHPTGRKTGKLLFPEVLMFSNTCCEFLKGIFSTEGTVYLCNKNQPRIALTMQEEKLMNEIYEKLVTLGFRPTRSVETKGERKLYKISLYGQEQAKLFKEKIGFMGAKRRKLEELLFCRETLNKTVIYSSVKINACSPVG